MPPPEPHKFHPREYAEMIEPLIRAGEKEGNVGNVFAWEGACHVHHQMSVEDITRIRKDDPGATVIVHGEVRPELQRAADAVLSTSQMAKYVDATPRRPGTRSSPNAAWSCGWSSTTPKSSSTSRAASAAT